MKRPPSVIPDVCNRESKVVFFTDKEKALDQSPTFLIGDLVHIVEDDRRRGH